jgi:hypothetical protein
LFVLGRVRLGVGDGIAGFSLSLTLAVASFVSNTSFDITILLLSGCFLQIMVRERGLSYR